MSLSEKIINLLKSARFGRNNNNVKDIIKQIEALHVEDDVIFNILWSLAIQPMYQGFPVGSAARILYETNIKCPLPLKKAILDLLQNWDLSIEEVPWYLVKQFSKSKMFETIASIESEMKTENEVNKYEHVRLKTIKYWIPLYRSKIDHPFFSMNESEQKNYLDLNDTDRKKYLKNYWS